jgi:hypothetical protein
MTTTNLENHSNRQEVIANLFPHAERARQGLENIHLNAEASYRYRGRRIDVEHIEVGENCPDLVFTVILGITPRKFKRLEEACAFVDGWIDLS